MFRNVITVRNALGRSCHAKQAGTMLAPWLLCARCQRGGSYSGVLNIQFSGAAWSWCVAELSTNALIFLFNELESVHQQNSGCWLHPRNQALRQGDSRRECQE